MAATMRIPTEFTAVDKFTSVVSKMTAGVSNFTKSTSSAVMRVNTKIDKVFSSMDGLSQLALGAGVGGMFVAAGKSVMDYEDALSSLEAVTGEKSSKFKGQIESIAKSTNKSAIDVASSFEVVGSAMSQYLGDPKALGQITQAGITLAKASRSELTPTLENLTSIMNQFGLGADKAEDSINRLTAGEIVGQVRTDQVAQSLKQFGAVANANNVTLDESVALVQVLGKKLPTDQLGTASRNLISFMSAAKAMPKEAREQLSKHGVSLDKLMNKNLSLGDRLKELSKIQGDNVAMTKFFGRENLAAGTVIFQNLKTYDQWHQKILTTNEAQNQAATNSRTMSQAIEAIKNSFINTVISGDELNGTLDTLKGAAGFLAANMGTIVKIVLAVIAAFAGFKVIVGIIQAVTMAQTAYNAVMAAYQAVALTAAFTGASFASVIWATLAPILAIIAAIAAVIAIFYYWDEIVSWFSKQWESFTTFISEFDFVGMFINIGQAIINYMLMPIRGVLALVSKLPGSIGAAAASGLDQLNKMTDLNMIVGRDVKKIDSPEQTNAKMMQENRVSGGVNVNIHDKGGNVRSAESTSNGGIPIKVTKTQGAY